MYNAIMHVYLEAYRLHQKKKKEKTYSQKINSYKRQKS